jgi:SPP1 gp7 family putative phage head morphogenesis protein
MAYKIAKTITFPKTLALKYEKYILKKLKTTISMLNSELKPFFLNNKINIDYRKDDYVDDLQKILDDIVTFITINENSLIRDLLLYGRSLTSYTRKQLYNSFKDILNVQVAAPSIAVNIFEYPILDKQIDLMVKSWVSTNTSLITSIQTDLLEQVGVVIESAYRSGLSIPDLTKQLQTKFNISKNRGRLIARDQTAKLHSDYIKHEHKLLGITQYIWLTTNDERTRASHKVLNNKVCQWDDALTYRDKENSSLKKKSSIGGVPLQVGQDYQCRCSLAAIVNL